MIRPLNSVRARLTAWNVGVVALVLALTGITLRTVLEVSLHGAVDRDLERRARSLQSDFEQDGPAWGVMPNLGFIREEVERELRASGIRDLINSGVLPPDMFKPGKDKASRSSDSAPSIAGLPNPPHPPSPLQLPQKSQKPQKPPKPQKNQTSPDEPPPYVPNDVPQEWRSDMPPADVRPRVLNREGRDQRFDGSLGPWDRKTFDQSLRGEQTYSVFIGEGRRLRVFSVPALREGRIDGVIQVVEPLEATERALRHLDGTLWVLVPIALIAAALGGAFLSGRALMPVRQVANAAEAIQAENLSQRLPVHGADEFAHLTRVLNTMLARLEAAFERQRRFTGDASHELRTPLAVIKATSSLATTDQWEVDACHGAMRSIEGAADRAEHIVEHLLLLARSDANTLLPDPRPVELDKALKAAVEEARVTAFKGTPILLEASQVAGCTVLGEFDQLCRVFINLLTNALRHTPADGRIIVAAERQAGVLIVQVADNGEGIPAAHLEHLGERFYRVDTARGRNRGGSGLGLAICKAILAAHNGTMTIDSSVGVGTVVTVTLPVSG